MESVDDEPAFKIVPIIVGSLTFEQEQMYGELLRPYFQRPDTLFVVSSDFCHWGFDFDYSPYENFNEDEESSCTPIWEFIEALDMAGIELIEKQDD